MNYQKEISRISTWMKEYSQQTKTRGFVIGLSGGIDSSVIACLAVKAIGSKNIIGISLPCDTREDMKEDAMKLADNLQIEIKTINLKPAFDEMVNKVTSMGVNNLIQSNIKARLRMTALYGAANLFNYLVVGTGNRSELDVGYCTKYGDGAVDMEPIGNYYKTEVYKMAELMPAIPQNVQTKAPSADLYPGQTDEEDLGMSYEVLDKILYALHQYDLKELGKYDIDLIEKVQKMIKKGKHKNELPPKCPRLKD